MLMQICFFLGGIFSQFQLCLLNMGNVYTPFDSHGHSYHVTHNRKSSHIGAHSFVRSSSLSRVPIVLSFNSCFHCTTFAYRRKTSQDSMRLHRTSLAYIVRNSYEYFFSYAINSATNDETYFFSVARIIGRFCSYTNCEMCFRRSSLIRAIRRVFF